jgi:sulfide:quinone oxidoreductase
MPTNVLIAGGGPAGLEAALRLHHVAAGHVTTTLLAPEGDFVYRPLSVLDPFAAGGATAYPLPRIANDGGFTYKPGVLARVDAVAHVATTRTGEQIAYDVLLVAAGATPVRPFEAATVFTGSDRDVEILHGLVQDVEGGYTHRVVFVVPEGASWPLPLYELALMLAERAYDTSASLELHLVTPEAAPLQAFGEEASREVARLLETAGIIVHTGTRAERVERAWVHLSPGGEAIEALRVVTLPRLIGHRFPGLPAGPDGFLVTDDHGRVAGVPDVYAAGDITAFPLKQGGLACQQADAAADHIAARAGANLDPQPFRPVIHGVLRTERSASFMRSEPGRESRVAGHPLWWPPTKIADRELAAYLQVVDEAHGHVRGVPVDLTVGRSDTDEIEVLSLN